MKNDTHAGLRATNSARSEGDYARGGGGSGAVGRRNSCCATRKVAVAVRWSLGGAACSARIAATAHADIRLHGPSPGEAGHESCETRSQPDGSSWNGPSRSDEPSIISWLIAIVPLSIAAG